MKKLFLTSLFATMVAMPAFADNNSYTNNQTYENSCTVDVLGESSGTAPATAQWSANSYSCAAGEYLPDGDNWTTDNQGCTQCPAGSYCWGDTFTYSESGDQGISSCDDEYTGTTSAAGATSMNACYWANVSCPTISSATACDAHAATCSYTGTTTGNYYPETNTYTGSCAVSFTCATGYTYSATQTAPAGLPSSATTPSSYQYRSHLYPNGGENSNNDNDLSAGEWKIRYSNGDEIKGIASCNNVPGNTNNYAYDTPSVFPTNTTLMSNSADATDATRRYCWCKMTGLTPSGGDETALSGAWVFYYDFEDAGNCADVCADLCAGNAVGDSGFRGALLGSVGASPQCVPNTITVNWGDGDNNPNNNPTTQCTYDGDLVTPTTAPTKRGYTFTGWTFSSQN